MKIFFYFEIKLFICLTLKKKIFFEYNSNKNLKDQISLKVIFRNICIERERERERVEYFVYPYNYKIYER